MKKISLVPYLRFKKYSTGFIGADEKKKDLLIVRLLIKIESNFNIKNVDFKMLDTNCVIGRSNTINRGVNTKNMRFEKPHDGFKIKLWMKRGGSVNIVVTFLDVETGNTHTISKMFTHAKLIKHKNNIKKLTKTLLIPEIPDVPEVPKIPKTSKPEQGYIPQKGDVVFSKSTGILGTLLRFLPAIREYIPVKAVASHVEFFITRFILFSAESIGLKNVLWEERKRKKKHIVVYRFKKKSDLKKIDMLLQKIVNRDLRGKKYNYFRWILNILVIFCFFLFFTGLFGIIFSWKFSVIIGILILILMLPVKSFLRKKSFGTFDCAGTVSYVFSKMGIYVPKVKYFHDSANSIKHVFENLHLHGIVEIVYKKGKI